jgi:AcrR family transcriptional regulator
VTTAAPEPASAEDRLMAAAVAAFGARGYAGVSIRQIARDAGLTIGALYHYADSKEALLLRLVRQAYGEGTNDIAVAARTGDSPSARLTSLVETHVRGEALERERWRLIGALARTELGSLSPEAKAEFVELRDRFEAVWDEVLRDGVDQGAFELEDVPIARFSLVKMCTGVADWYRPDGRLSLDEIASIMSRQALALVRARDQ